ncbi:hypothetical protein DTO166G4_8075 [Paecilomyces variotii]|uniref:Mitochondrial import inner membrane translocase subunit n=1 Tax=Byssochlamys spectabilis TaxID=264951 RepID=A0A443I234_BYSSP|nr:Tim10/DDP family zinc finger-domain-containing protein [Paecilomyces variotii]KAJ9209040.1 hypothetical protein DTO032I3_257 [Paecilomyces variotii]KAJ9210300.1 hypothetical protein DTO166G4_8075 [Paecilomyces variotii]KAJ9224764.1 hypothetical protein DTO169C6_3015 [Paecilomyces variotii]KAJ9233087.1 hypothetical protein DTO166G5_5884 [Paecilomyces variotii]KAJ9245400.1 hypothetical protein DTO169E5_705 [Paecilomyces variotii]
MSSFFGGSSSSSSPAAPNSSEEMKTAIMKQLQAEAAMTNARALIGKLNEHCFDRCIPTPGDSLSSKEESCLSTCMEKYISTWNTVSRTYISRVSKESKKLGGQDSAAMASMATGGSGLL